jgi:hypothetical protein
MPPRPPVEKTSSDEEDDSDDDDSDDDGEDDGEDVLPTWAKIRQSEKYSTPRGSNKSSGGGAPAQSPVLTDARSNTKGYYLTAGVALSQRQDGFDRSGYGGSPLRGRGSPGPYSFANHPTRDMARSPYKSPYGQTPPKGHYASPGGRMYPPRSQAMRSPAVRGSPSMSMTRGTPPSYARPPLPRGTSTLAERAAATISMTRTPSPGRRLGGTFSPRRPFHLPGPKGSPVCSFGSGH